MSMGSRTFKDGRGKTGLFIPTTAVLWLLFGVKVNCLKLMGAEDLGFSGWYKGEICSVLVLK